MTEIKATTDAESERNLARSLGYPQSWHVVRVQPHPALLEEDSEAATNTAASFMDVIYAGDPSAGVDVYYNHSAALSAALEWKNGESTGFENQGGQMLPRVPKFKKDSWVEVYYPDEDKWYKAQVKKVKPYVNDVRYSVHYPDEDATQMVSEDLLRAFDIPPSSSKKRKGVSTSTISPAKKPKSREEPTAQKTKRKYTKRSPKTTDSFNKAESFENYLHRLSVEELESRRKLAKEMGLPENWLAHRNYNYVFDIRNPQGERFVSKKAAFDSLNQVSLDEPSDSKDMQEESKLTAVQVNSLEVYDDDDDDEGDPPFRKTGHIYLGRKVKYTHYPEGEGGIEVVQSGIIQGWLDKSDVDSNGDPAFISELTGEPGILFHVVFPVDVVAAKEVPTDFLLEYIDIELWEVEELFDLK